MGAHLGACVLAPHSRDQVLRKVEAGDTCGKPQLHHTHLAVHAGPQGACYTWRVLDCHLDSLGSGPIALVPGRPALVPPCAPCKFHAPLGFTLTAASPEVSLSHFPEEDAEAQG